MFRIHINWIRIRPKNWIRIRIQAIWKKFKITSWLFDFLKKSQLKDTRRMKSIKSKIMFWLLNKTFHSQPDPDLMLIQIRSSKTGSDLDPAKKSDSSESDPPYWWIKAPVLEWNRSQNSNWLAPKGGGGMQPMQARGRRGNALETVRGKYILQYDRLKESKTGLNNPSLGKTSEWQAYRGIGLNISLLLVVKCFR